MKHAHLLKDEKVRRWLGNLGRGSKITAEVKWRQIGKICELINKTPKQMVNSAKKDMDKFQDSLEDMVTKLEEQKKSPQYIISLQKAVKSWMKYNNIAMTRTIKVSNASATPTIANEQVPTKEELTRILHASPPRIRFAEALMAFADLRPEVIGNFHGDDGLTIGDLPELKIENGQVTFEKIPTMVKVRFMLSKTRKPYFTFLFQEGCNLLKEYLEQRLRAGEKLTPESPVMGFEKPGNKKNQFISTRRIGTLIRKYMRDAGVKKRPYVLRHYAETQLTIAESKGKITHPYLQFFAGHKGDIEATYSTEKGRLPPDMIDVMRSQYQACESYLGTTNTISDQSEVVKRTQLAVLKSLAKNAGIDLLDAKIGKVTGINRELTIEEEIALYENELSILRERPPHEDEEQKYESKLVTEDKLEKYLNNGWEMVQNINSKILIRRRLHTPETKEKQKKIESYLAQEEKKTQEPHVKTEEEAEFKLTKETKKALAGLSKLSQEDR